MKKSDRELGLHLPISRREFCQGAACAVGASFTGLGHAAAFDGSPEILSGYYPPARTGLRGSHPGSFETAHAVAHQGKRWTEATDTGESAWDLVVVGAGLSGLAAAWFWHQEKPGARILLLENHDDFGGHARRNEFEVNGRKLIGYGGSQSIDTPASFSPEARGLLEALGIRVDAFYEYFDRSLYASLGLRPGFWLDRDTFGVDRLVRGNPLFWGESRDDPAQVSAFARDITTSEADQAVMRSILESGRDLLPEMSSAERVAWLRSLSYEQFLRQEYGASERVLRIFSRLPKGLWGSGADAVSALEALKMGFPGMDRMGIDLSRDDPWYHELPDEPYIFHFPDGNAGIARLLVRQLIPGVAAGNSMEDVVQAPFDYTRLDQAGQPVCLRLNATAVEIAHPGGGPFVRVRYVKSGKAFDVHATNVIWAGYAHMLRHVCADFPPSQAAAFDQMPRIPLVYGTLAVRNWRPFAEAGISWLNFPNGLWDSVALDFPVSMGGYQFSASPSEPVLLHGQCIPTHPGGGRDARQQAVDGRRRLFGLTFEDFERAVRQQAADALGAHGFDPARDILAMTVNRWPHGYAWEYNDLVDSPGHDRYAGPHVAARKGFGRVSMAGTDTEAYAYANGAIDAAWRAVRERLG